MAKHMDSITRNQIQFWIESGKSVAWIAQQFGKHPSTVWRELLNHRIKSDKRYGCSNRLCAKFDVCTRQSYGASDYKALVNCRAGVRPDDATAAKMGEAIRDGLTKGQSVKHILRANAELFGHYAESTVYGWINDGLFGYVGRSMLPFACCRRKPRRRPVTKTNAKCRVGRTMKELYAFLSANPGIVPTELDTVIGSISGKVLFTMCFPKSRLALAFLRDARTSQTCTRIFEKGMPFDSIEQQHVNLAMSHINSLTRDTLDGKCAYDAFVEEFGDEDRLFLKKLGIVRIPANQVTLHPFLLGAKFQKIADRTRAVSHNPLAVSTAN